MSSSPTKRVVTGDDKKEADVEDNKGSFMAEVFDNEMGQWGQLRSTISAPLPVQGNADDVLGCSDPTKH